jgi:hypothetical protein
VSRGVNRLLAVAFAAGAFAAIAALVAAPAALACSGGPSAYNVYKECLSNGGSGGGGHKGGGSGGSTNPTSTGGSQSSSTTTPPPPPPVSKQAKKAISHAGKDARALKSLYEANGKARFLYTSHASTPVSEPTAIGSAFDIGSGPTALLVALAGTAVLLLAMTGVRGARRRR